MRSLVFRTLVFAGMWWVLTEGVVASWVVGVPVVVLAVVVSGALQPPGRWSVSGIIRFIPFFLWHSLRGGMDVAARALHPRLPITPALVDRPWCLPPGLPRVLMANTVSLLPGTLSAELNDRCLRVHVLDHKGPYAAELRLIETRVAALFGLQPDDCRGDE